MIMMIPPVSRFIQRIVRSLNRFLNLLSSHVVTNQ